jgi:hypothetical protein
VKKYCSHFAMLPVISIVSAAAPVAAEASNWIWDKGNQAVNRVSGDQSWHINGQYGVSFSFLVPDRQRLKCFM